MVELTPQERLQPCLLDRLADQHPEKPQEGRDERIVSVRQYREAVLRDLVWLLNAHSHPPGDEIYEYPAAADSVLNFGIRELSGMTTAGLDPRAIERELVQAIQRYEPRIVPQSLSVKTAGGAERIEHAAVAFEIRGELWAQPLPEQLYIKTEIDLETGECNLSESGRG
ncbi:MAG: hypothetical protein BWK77_02455 [Verrucomicrobia bacterium A1]|nr:MAG: hypothetical protein BWK77_02455 [Verrucomicrobia bacterium A1]